MFRWLSEFNRGRNSLHDKFGESRPKSALVPENIDTVRELILQANHATQLEIEANLGISSTRTHLILYERLAVKKIG